MSEDNGGQEARRLRKPGVFFWVFVACFAVALPLAVIDGDLLDAGLLSAIALSVVLQRTGLAERPGSWKRLANASAVAVGLLLVLLILTDLGIL